MSAPPNDGIALRGLAAVARVADSSVLAGFGAVLIALLIGYAAMSPIANSDFGWHVAMGRFIVENSSIPSVEPFSHTAIGAPMVPHEWLSQTLYYLLIKASGVYALRWVHAAMAVLCIGLLVRILRRSGATPALCLLGVASWAVVAEGRIQVRPQIFNVVLLLSMYGYLFVRRPVLRRREIAGVFFVTVVWINLHSGAVLFSAIVVGYAVLELLQQKFLGYVPKSGDLAGGKVIRLFALAGAVTLALVVTPSQLRIFPYVAESAALNSRFSLEWFPILDLWGRSAEQLSISLVAAIAAATVLLAFFCIGRRSFSDIGVALFVAFLPFSSARFKWVYFIPLIVLVSEISGQLRRDPKAGLLDGRETLRQGCAVGSVVLAALLVLCSPLSNLGGEGRENRFSSKANFASAKFPHGAARFLDDLNLQGRLYNSSGWGGFVLMQTHDKYPVFIDGRWVTIGEKVLRDAGQIERRGPRAFELLAAYGIDILLVERGWMTAQLLAEKEWVTVFENFNSGVYLRRGPGSRANLAKCRAYYAARGIPFDEQIGYVAAAAFESNSEWARQLDVRSFHLEPAQGPGRDRFTRVDGG